MKTMPLPFSNPFQKNHCVVLAFTVLRNGTADDALKLAETAKRTRASQFGDRFGSAFLIDRNGASTNTAGRISRWGDITGLRYIEKFEPAFEYKRTRRKLRGYYTWDDDGNHVPATIEVVQRVGRPTLAQFLRTTGRRGRWFVLVRAHAVAVINGKAYGNCEARSRVHIAFRMEQA